MQTNAMISSGWMVVMVFLCLSVLHAQSQNAVATLDNDQNLTVTSRTDDYVIQNHRQYNAVIQQMESDIAAFQVDYENQLAVIKTQSTMVENKITEMEKYLLPLEMLNDLWKHCTQKYKGRISTVASVRSSIANCVATATNAFNSIVTDARNTKNNLNNWYNNQFVGLINDCKKKFANAPLNYTNCVTQAVATGDSVTVANQKNFNTYLQQSTCSGESKVKAALECSFTIVESTTSMIGETKYRINNCGQGNEYCPPCMVPPTPTPGPDINQTCAHEINVSMSLNDYRNVTISNPFFGLNSTIPCVLVNFDRRGLARLL